MEVASVRLSTVSRQRSQTLFSGIATQRSAVLVMFSLIQRNYILFLFFSSSSTAQKTGPAATFTGCSTRFSIFDFRCDFSSYKTVWGNGSIFPVHFNSLPEDARFISSLAYVSISYPVQLFGVSSGSTPTLAVNVPYSNFGMKWRCEAYFSGQ